jgi:hypothetical protein
MRIPAHPDLNVPASIRANAYPAAEAGGMIWTRLDSAGDRLVLDLPTSIEPLASIAVDAGPEAIATAAGTSIADGAPLFSLSHGDMVLHLGWHSVHAEKTMLHAAVEASNDRQSAMRRLRELRAAAEQEVAA